MMRYINLWAASLLLLSSIHAAPSRAASVAEDTVIQAADGHFQKSFLQKDEKQDEELIAAQRILVAALERLPNSADLHAKYAQVTGRLALFRGNKEKIKLGKTIKDHADRALTINPEQPMANAVLGVWHYELAQLSGFQRFFAKILYGEVPDGDLSLASQHLSLAVRLAPQEIFYRVALAKVFLAENRKEEAVALLKSAIALPARSTSDPELKKEAKELLS